jgi:hypothetical protein
LLPPRDDSTPALTRELAKPIPQPAVAVTAAHSQVGAFDLRKIDQMVGNALPCGRLLQT